MDCPRCGAPNLPGLPVCVDCGQDLGAEPDVPENLVPRARVANPLAERRPRPPRPRRRRVSPFAHVGRLRHLPWEAFGAGLRGLVRGCVPGLLPALRRDRRGALIQLGAVLLPVIILVSFGGRYALGTYGFLVALGWSLSPFQEVQRSMDTPEPFRTSASWLLCLGPALAFSWLLRLAVLPAPPMIFHFTPAGSLLPGQAFVVRTGDGALTRGTLVAFDRHDVEARLARLQSLLVADGAGEGGPSPAVATYQRYLEVYPYFASPVVALEGDVLTSEGEIVRVDGAPSDALPIADWPRQPVAPETAGSPIPAGHVAVWDWIPYPTSQCLHLVVIPRELVLGRITQVLMPNGPPLDLRWPEDAVRARQNEEPP